MSYKNSIEGKNARRRERAEHQPQLCLAGKTSFGKKLTKVLAKRSAAQLINMVKRAGRRALPLLGSNDLKKAERARFLIAVGNVAANVYNARIKTPIVA